MPGQEFTKRDVVAYSAGETVYFTTTKTKVPSQGSGQSNASMHYAAGAGNPKDKSVNEIRGDRGGRVFAQPIFGFIKEAKNGGKVTAQSKVIYSGNGQGKANEVFREESSTSDNKGVIQGLVGQGKTSEPKASEKNHLSAKSGESGEHGQVKVASGSKPKD